MTHNLRDVGLVQPEPTSNIFLCVLAMMPRLLRGVESANLSNLRCVEPGHAVRGSSCLSALIYAVLGILLGSAYIHVIGIHAEAHPTQMPDLESPRDWTLGHLIADTMSQKDPAGSGLTNLSVSANGRTGFPSPAIPLWSEGPCSVNVTPEANIERCCFCHNHILPGTTSYVKLLTTTSRTGLAGEITPTRQLGFI